MGKKTCMYVCMFCMYVYIYIYIYTYIHDMKQRSGHLEHRQAGFGAAPSFPGKSADRRALDRQTDRQTDR